MSKEKCWLGFDVGKNGAICGITSHGEITTQVMPLVNEEISLKTLSDILEIYSEEYDIVCGVEDIHSIFGSSAKSNFQFGRSLGILEGLLASKRLPFIKIAPKTWQKLCFMGVSETRKLPTAEQIANAAKKQKSPQGSIDTKAMALLAAQRLFPKETFLASSRSKKPHDGIVDALLIAYFLKCNYQ